MDHLFERRSSCIPPISSWSAGPAPVRDEAHTAGAVAASFGRAFTCLGEGLVHASLLLQQWNVALLRDAAISMLTARASVWRIVGRRMVSGCRTFRYFCSAFHTRTPRHVNLSLAVPIFHSLVVQLCPSRAGGGCSFSGRTWSFAKRKTSSGSSRRTACDALACVRLR